MNPEHDRSGRPASGDLRGGSKSRSGRMARSVQAFLVAALSIAILLCFGYMLVAGLFASGNPGLSRRIMTEINRAVGTDSTRFTADRVRGTVLRGAVVENPR